TNWHVGLLAIKVFVEFRCSAGKGSLGGMRRAGDRLSLAEFRLRFRVLLREKDPKSRCETNSCPSTRVSPLGKMPRSHLRRGDTFENRLENARPRRGSRIPPTKKAAQARTGNLGCHVFRREDSDGSTIRRECFSRV